ncbi:MAG: hypothetical protein LBO79_10095 [Zoogloeaceae bacterium]|jgi:curli biogenesis system outer membrane secretion channel CsgG|nr:hypothetical protein [Zoogloeaceae bacterium]
MTNLCKKLFLPLLLAMSALTAQAETPLKVAVTDLAYEERVREYFRNIRASSNASLKASGQSSHGRHFHQGSSRVDAKSSSTFSYEEGTYSYIDRGELRKFTADIKGEMVKSGLFQVTQARPYTAKNLEGLHDIIARVKRGQFPNAKYVLFGTVSSIEFRQEANPIDHTDTVSHILSLDLVADFSLVNTRTYEVVAAFSATGEGQDTKLMSSAGGRIVLNRGKVISEVSKSLGEDVIRQLEEQLGVVEEGFVSRSVSVEQRRVNQQEKVIIFR